MQEWKFKAAAMAAAAASALSVGSNAFSADVTINMQDDIPGQSWVATLSVDAMDAFTGIGGADTLTFIMSGAPIGTFAVSFGIFGNFVTNFSEGVLSAGQVSQALALQNVGPYFAFGQGGLQDVLIEDGQFSVTVTGPYTSGYEVYAAAELISAVPEPETYALFLAGLAAFGFIAFRKQAQRG